MSRERRYSRKEPPAACPYCESKIPRPSPLTDEAGPDACRGGHCPVCNALYVLDETGKAGGQSLLDVLSLLCDGDLNAGLTLRAGVDYDLREVGYNPRTHSLDPRGMRRRFGLPKLWFVKRAATPDQPVAT